MIQVTDLHAEYVRGAVTFVATSRPRLTWRTLTTTPNWTQASAELRVTRSDGHSENHRVSGADSVLVSWPFTPLAVRERVTAAVRVIGADGAISGWATPITLEAASLDPGSWHADLVAHPDPEENLRPVQFIRDFAVRDGLVAARLRTSAHGVYQAEINSAVVSDDVLAPGWTSYDERLLVQTADVTALLRAGANRLAATVAAGWFGESFGFLGHAKRAYAGPLSYLAQLELDYTDGTTDVIATDADWLATRSGPIVQSGIYAGERHDARLETVGWSSVGVPLPDLMPVTVIALDREVLAPATSEPVRRIETMAPVQSFLTPTGRRVLDFGQNIAGRVRIEVTGAAGDVVTLRHAEVLDVDGELALRPLRLAKATDEYTLAGNEREVWEPLFTFHGFRYVQVDGWPGGADPIDDLTAVVCHSDMSRTGSWSSSHPQLNRLHENVLWSMRGNFLSIPSDCPQRDERLGWTGDFQLFAPTASFLYDVRGFSASWLADLAIEQRQCDGITPLVIPSVLPPFPDPIAGWGDASTVVPWTMYERYGDRGILNGQYPSMRAWVEAELGRTNSALLWLHGGQIGDHLDPTAPPDRPTEAKTSPAIVACAYLIRSLRIVADAALTLGLHDDAAHYAESAETARAAFEHYFVTPGGRIISDAPTAYALAIAFDLVTEPVKRAALGERLAEIVRENGFRIGTGFIGTPVLVEALIATGHLHTASNLLLQTRAPSWLYAVTMGATTVWERWDSLLPDGSVNPGEMTSFNHYALGAVADTLHRRVAGLAPGAPGYSLLDVAPQPLPGLTSAAATIDTPYGRAQVGWSIENDVLALQVEVPANTGANVTLPGSAEVFRVGSGRHDFSCPAPSERAVLGPVDIRGTDLATLIDDAEALGVIVQALAVRDPARSASLLTDTQWKRGAYLTDVLMFAGPEVLADVERALEDLNRNRGARSDMQ
jgi:alpha-L-rhamnosidase